MADLARKAATVAAGDGAILRTGALLLFVVFAIKAAAVPLHWWLPTAYGAAPAPAAALFAILTKVGAYAIIRVYTLVFGPDGGPAAGVAGPWLLPAALAGLAVGALGVLASRSLVNLVSFSGLAAALYYAIHSTLIAASLFLLAEIVAARRGASRDLLVPAAPVAGAALLSGLFFLAGIAMAGLPPLSGFAGKLLILMAGPAVVTGPALLSCRTAACCAPGPESAVSRASWSSSPSSALTARPGSKRAGRLARLSPALA